MPRPPPPESDWERRHAAPSLDLDALRAVLAPVVGSAGVDSVAVVGGGQSSGTYRVRACGRDLAVRVHRHGPEGVRREVAVLERMKDTVPLAPVLHADPARAVTVHPWVEGARLVDVLHQRSSARGLGRSTGAALRRLHAHSMPSPGLLGAEGTVETPFLTIREAWAAFVPPDVACRYGSWLDERPVVLLHGDYKPTNLLVDPATEAVVAVLDWEFAWAGPPLADVGQLLRWEDRVPPDFAQGFADAYFGDDRPERWREQALLLDWINLATFVAEGGPRCRADAIERIDRTRSRLASMPHG